MKVFIKDTGSEVELPNNCVSGGEGDVYIKGNFAYKIYHDINKALNEEKFSELKVLDKENIIKPEHLIYNNKDQIIGYVMKAIPKCYPLSRLITNDFRNQHQITNEQILKLIQKMKETFEFIHQKNCLVIDGNEMNYLVDEKFENIYFIDVDSYQTQKYNANAYSPSTLDPIAEKNRKFSIFSDWFIFGIVSCSLLVGIHPFKGSYKGLSKNFKKGDLKSRMESSISIFNKNVSVNSAVRSFSIIPEHYKKWFIDIFESKKRIEPPKNIFDITVSVKESIRKVIFDEKVKSKNLYTAKDNIIDIYISENNKFIKFNNSFFDILKNKNYKFKDNKTLFLEIDKKPFLIKVDNKIKLFDINNGNNIETDIVSNSIFIIDNRIYSIYSNKINELKIFNNKLLIENSWDIIESNTDLFTNVLVQKIYNRNILYIPFKNQYCSINNIKDLNDYKIINAFFKNKILEIVGFINNEYRRLIFKFDDNINNYEIIFNEETDNLNINAITLDNGVFISIFKDNELFLTVNRLNKNDINIIKDKNISLNDKLYSNKNDVYLIVNNEINQISLT